MSVTPFVWLSASDSDGSSRDVFMNVHALGDLSFDKIPRNDGLYEGCVPVFIEDSQTSRHVRRYAASDVHAGELLNTLPLLSGSPKELQDDILKCQNEWRKVVAGYGTESETAFVRDAPDGGHKHALSFHKMGSGAKMKVDLQSIVCIDTNDDGSRGSEIHYLDDHGTLSSVRSKEDSASLADALQAAYEAYHQSHEMTAPDKRRRPLPETPQRVSNGCEAQYFDL